MQAVASSENDHTWNYSPSNTPIFGTYNRLFQLPEHKVIFRLGHQTWGRKPLPEVGKGGRGWFKGEPEGHTPSQGFIQIFRMIAIVTLWLVYQARPISTLLLTLQKKKKKKKKKGLANSWIHHCSWRFVYMLIKIQLYIMSMSQLHLPGSQPNAGLGSSTIPFLRPFISMQTSLGVDFSFLPDKSF